MDELTDNPLFADPGARLRFPAPIAVALDVMVSEIAESGEVTTADETAAAIEATFLWLGRLWVAEYLHAIERNEQLASEAINQELIERAVSARGVTTGRWVGLARAIRAQLSGHDTVVEGLDAIPFGDATGQLLHFRNHFSHGSFASTVDEIRTHRTLLHDLLQRVPALWTQVPLCREPETGVVRAASGAWPVVEAPAGMELPDAHPVIAGADGQALDLYPLLHWTSGPGGLRLSAPDSTHPISELTKRTALAAWLERYTRHQDGHLPYASASTAGALPAGAVAALKANLTGMVLVEAHPGCGGGAAVAALTTDDPLGLGLDAFAAIRRVEVIPGDLGQSGVTVARVVLRLIEDALGEAPDTRAATAAELVEPGGPLQQALADLSASGARAVLGIENLHHGTVAYRGEPLTVREVYEQLAGSAVTVVATVVPGIINRPLFDHKVEVGVTAAPDAQAVAAWVDRLTAGRGLHRRVLECLTQGDPSHLFALCDALEADGGDPVFEPAVERALWDLRPLLQWERTEHETEEGQTERVRVWSPFAPVVAHAMSTAGGEA